MSDIYSTYPNQNLELKYRLRCVFSCLCFSSMVAITQYQKNNGFPSDNSAKSFIFKSIFFYESLVISKKENYFM